MEFKDLNLLDVGNTVQLVGAIWADEQTEYACYFPGEQPRQGARQLLMTSPEWEKFVRQSDLMETEILALAKDGKLAKIIVRKANRQIEANVSWRVFKRDGYQCRYCGAEGVPLSIDHLILWEALGPTIEANLVTACKPCNRARGNLLYEDWLKSAEYEKRSRKIAPAVKAQNEALLATLASIPLMKHMRSR